MNNFKFLILSKIEDSVPVFYKATSEEYKIRCPFCGDSQKNFKSAHLYIKCSNDLSEPLFYHCFKCNRSGKVGNDFLKLVGVKNFTIDEENKIINKLNYFKNNKLMIESKILENAVNYIIKRIGVKFSQEDLLKFRLISLDDIRKLVSNKIKNTLPLDSDFISFILEDNSMIVSRNLFDFEPRWKKIKLFKDGTSVYTIKTLINLFSKEEITVNICEGIFDSIGLFNLFNNKNTLFISVLSSEYSKGVEYALNKGIFGSSVTVNIFMDSDINDFQIKKSVSEFKWLFKNIKFYKNKLNHDFGIPKSMIEIVEV